ncbi:hypothetical protein U1Q18_025473 [Sarracenia purpurea var. burkii]
MSELSRRGTKLGLGLYLSHCLHCGGFCTVHGGALVQPSIPLLEGLIELVGLASPPGHIVDLTPVSGFPLADQSTAP